MRSFCDLPQLTYLAYSGGKQSHALLDLVLRGIITKPKRFIVICANPGMEDSRSAAFVTKAEEECNNRQIPFLRAEGGNLYNDLIELKDKQTTRLDNPPYWTLDSNGRSGRLKQKCTLAYKIIPMRRALRKWMNENMGVSLVTKRLPLVEAWIGFSADEQLRANKATADVGYIQFKFPLIELSYDANKIMGHYLKYNISIPPRSVCNACFANGLDYLERMYRERPEDWKKAVAVDDSLEHFHKIGVFDEVFVSSSLKRLRDLPKLNWLKNDEIQHEKHKCNSGYCFT